MRTKSIWIALGLGAALFAYGTGQQDDFKRERGGSTAALKNSLEGKEPPALQVTEWLNSDGKEINWKTLKGKVVLIDFWAHW